MATPREYSFKNDNNDFLLTDDDAVLAGEDKIYSLPAILRVFFLKPFDRHTRPYFQNRAPALKGVILLLASCIMVSGFLFLSFKASGNEIEREAENLILLVQAAIIPVSCFIIFTIVHTIMRAFIKPSGVSFFSELLGAGLVVFSLSLLMIIPFIMSLFSESPVFFPLLYPGRSSSTTGALFFIILMTFLFVVPTMMLMQVFRAWGMKDIAAYLLAPVILVLVVYAGAMAATPVIEAID
jgi:hypothetical protein